SSDVCSSDLTTPFDIEHGPLVRARLARVGAAEHLLHVTGHHIVCDGWSAAVVLHDLGALYSCVELPPAVPFSRYAAEEAHDPAAEAYWLGRFAGEAPVLDLPTDRPRPALRTFAA